MARDIDQGIDRALAAKERGDAVSIGVLCNAVELLARLIERGVVPDTLTDQTSAHDPLIGYYPEDMDVEAADKLRRNDPSKYTELSYKTMVKHVELMLALQKMGSITFDYGNNLRGRALEKGLKNAFDFPGFVPAYIRPLFCQGKGPFRWVALSGDPEDIYVTDRKILELFPENESLKRWIGMAQEKIEFQGLPARICWLGQGERQKAALAFNELVRTGAVKAPIVIGRDHLDTGSVASPNRETEAMMDGSDAVADWPILNAFVNVAGGASWVSLHHGGGVGLGYSIHSGMVIVADGTLEAENRIRRVLRNDPGIGVIRHMDAGYDSARQTAKGQHRESRERLAEEGRGRGGARAIGRWLVRVSPGHICFSGCKRHPLWRDCRPSACSEFPLTSPTRPSGPTRGSPPSCRHRPLAARAVDAAERCTRAVAVGVLGARLAHEVEGREIRHLVRALDARYPGIAARLHDGMAVAIDGVIHQNAFLEDVPDGAEVCFIPAIEGG